MLRDLLLAFALFTVVLAACTSAPPVSASADERVLERDDEVLRALLQGYSEDFAAIVIGAADRIKASADDLEVKRRASLWQLRSPSLCNSTVAQRNPRLALVDVVALAARQRAAIEAGKLETYAPIDGGLFGRWTPLAIEAVREAEARAWQLAERLMAEGDLRKLREEVDEWLIEGEETMLGVDRLERLDQRISVGHEPDARQGLFGELEAGVDQSVRELYTLNLAAERLSQQLMYAPINWRWSLEVLLFEQFSSGPLAKSAADLSSTARALDKLASRAEALPVEELSELLCQLVGIESGAPELADSLLQRSEALLTRLERMGQPDGVAGQLGRAAAAWEGALRNADAILARLDASETGESGALDDELRRAEGLVAELRSLADETKVMLDPDGEIFRTGLSPLRDELNASTDLLARQSIRVVRAASAYVAGLMILAFVLVRLGRLRARRDWLE